MLDSRVSIQRFTIHASTLQRFTFHDSRITRHLSLPSGRNFSEGGFLIETRSLSPLARRYHRDFAFYLAYPISSILTSAFLAKPSCMPRRRLRRRVAPEVAAATVGGSWISRRLVTFVGFCYLPRSHAFPRRARSREDRFTATAMWLDSTRSLYNKSSRWTGAVL